MNAARKEMLAELRRTLVEILYIRSFEEYGRLIAYQIDNPGEKFYFHFRPDGCGFVEDESEAIEFRWTDAPVSHEHLRSMSEEDLKSIANTLFRSTIGRSLSDPYVFDIPELMRPNIEFLSGSKDEIERITRMICHWDHTVLAHRQIIEVHYVASWELEPGGFGHTHLPFSANALALFALAFEHNPFTGEGWEYMDGGRYRLSDFSRSPAALTVKVLAPSAHERAEAFLELADWLVGKVSQSERRELLGISD